MGTSYTIDPGRRMVHGRAWGTLTTRELLDETSRKLADPRFDSSFRSLCDLREVTRLEIDSVALVHMASTPVFDEAARGAIVATSDAVYGVARMYASYCERRGREVRVFRDMGVAEAWLTEAV